MKEKWYTLKTIYKISSSGKPKRGIKNYDSDIVLIEERIILLKASNVDKAIEKAEKEAEAYAKSTKFYNPFGQKVITKYLGICDAFELFDEPVENNEVFSSTRILNKKTSKKEIEEIFLGKQETDQTRAKRIKFCNKEFYEEKI